MEWKEEKLPSGQVDLTCCFNDKFDFVLSKAASSDLWAWQVVTCDEVVTSQDYQNQHSMYDSALAALNALTAYMKAERKKDLTRIERRELFGHNKTEIRLFRGFSIYV